MKTCSFLVILCLSFAGAQNATLAPTPSGAVSVDTCFNLGTNYGRGLLIRNGLYIERQVLLPEIKFYAEFAVWLNEDCPDVVHEFTVVEIVSPGLTSKWITRGVGANKLSATGVIRGQVVLEWTCPAAPSEVDYPVEVTLSTAKPAGTGAGTFGEVTFKVMKKCFPPVAPEDGGGGGWSPFGTFVFVVFILTLVGCVAGCAFNKVKRDKTGWEVVPGAGLVSMALGKCLKEPRYTPQMDYDTPVGEDNDHYGATYQADL